MMVLVACDGRMFCVCECVYQLIYCVNDNDVIQACSCTEREYHNYHVGSVQEIQP